MKIKCVDNDNGMMDHALTVGKDYQVLRFTSDYTHIKTVQVTNDRGEDEWYMGYFERKEIPSIQDVEKQMEDIQRKLHLKSSGDETIDESAEYLLKMEDALQDQLNHLYEL